MFLTDVVKGTLSCQVLKATVYYYFRILLKSEQLKSKQKPGAHFFASKAFGKVSARNLFDLCVAGINEIRLSLKYNGC